jgi:hypothetical protein
MSSTPAPRPAAAPVSWGFWRMRFDRYTVTLLTQRPDAPAMTDEQAAELQDRHLAHGADLPRSVAEAMAD